MGAAFPLLFRPLKRMFMTMDIDHGHNIKRTREIPAGEFKAKCLKLMDEVQQTGEEVIITKRGKPVAKLVPAAKEKPFLFGSMKGSVRITGDIVGPILDEDWEEQWLKKWDRRLAETGGKKQERE